MAIRGRGVSGTTEMTHTPARATSPDRDRHDASRAYVRAYVRRHGRRRAAEAFGVSRHTLWRCLARGHMGHALPRAVLHAVGESVEALDAATRALSAPPAARGPNASRQLLPQGLADTLVLLCAAPLTTVRELSRISRVPTSTLRDRLEKLAKLGLADCVPHHLSALGARPQLRYFPTAQGITTADAAIKGEASILRAYPVSKQWVRLLAERLDAIAVLYRVAALIADADPQQQPVRVDHYRRGPYDLRLTLSGGRSIGLIRQGPMLPTANLRYRLRTTERMASDERPFVTLVLTHADQATRRAIRALGDPLEHRRTFVAMEGGQLAGDAEAVVWQQGGNGLGDNPPVHIVPNASLAGILAWMDRLWASTSSCLGDSPTPHPDALDASGVQASMPEPSQQLGAALSVQLTCGDKDALDLLAAWPLGTREQLAGLMGGVTRRRVNQVLRSLRQRGLVRADGPQHILTDAGLTYLARRDRTAVGLTLDRWSPEPSHSNPDVYAGTALHALAAQRRHHAGVIGFAAALSAEVARSPDHDLVDLLPTARASIAYRDDGTTYVIHPDASFTLEDHGRWRSYLLEFERRATTPRRVAARLASYRRYVQSGWAERDHEGHLPQVLFVFESPGSEAAFLGIADELTGVPIITSNAETLAARGILGDAWILPPPHSLDRRPLATLDPVA